MKSKLINLCVLTIITALGLSFMPQETSAQSPGGWAMLFDGKSLDNWTPIGTANWTIDDGSIVADNGNGFLVSKNDYADFELRVEFWVEPKTNSGVFIRCTDPKDVTSKNSYEVNIWDTRPDPKYGTGAIVDLGAVDPMPTAGGKWNVYEIVAKGDTFDVTLNGQKTVSGARSNKFSRGRISLQHGKGVADETGVVKFRKIEIKSL